DPAGNLTVESVSVNVTATASLEPLPKGWDDMKKEDRYWRGRNYFPSANLVEADITALPDYGIEVKVKDSMDSDCVLKYLPREGRAEVNKTHKTTTIMLGGQYSSKSVKKVRRDLYEDLYNYLGLILKRIEAVRISGGYQLEELKIADQPGLVSATGVDNIYLPEINLSFDDRYYQPTIFSKADPMMIADVPTIKIDFNTSSGLIWRRSRLWIDETEYNATKGDFSLVVVKPYKDASTFDVNYGMYTLVVPAVKKLPFGEHHIVFEIENAFGLIVSKEAFTRVITVPSQIVGKPMVFPNPFSPERDREVKIQYNLTLPANIEIVVFGGDGSTVMKKRYSSGDDGGKKGYNTVTWSGRTDAGFTVSNGIYIGVIIDKDENRILEKFRLSVFR
ncbi:MAG: hypothetical protein PHH60_06160, partial [Candidatus Margulisbacteria bacterium]|nr:hypothetical protein [Candidatus Margulisiibacteriota bacterium]